MVLYNVRRLRGYVILDCFAYLLIVSPYMSADDVERQPVSMAEQSGLEHDASRDQVSCALLYPLSIIPASVVQTIDTE